MIKYLSKSFYQGPDVVEIARHLLGKYLFSSVNGFETGGRIVEVEAYCGARDKASHAFPDKVTPRTRVMYEAGGIAYVYFVYGMHHMFNVVTNIEGRADAVLIRAIEPIHGTAIMQERRQLTKTDYQLTGGPARLAQALGIDLTMNQASLFSNKVWITEGESISANEIAVTTRVGVDYAEEDALLPWRFFIRDNPFVSRSK